MNTIKKKSPKFIYIILLFYCFKIIKLELSLVNPHGINLNSGEILIIHKFGVTVYNFDLTNIQRQIVKFGENELIETEEDLSKLTVESFDGYIFSIIKDKLYIFNEKDGELSYNDRNIINQPQNIEYYTLEPVNITNNIKYSYVIGYVNSNHLLNLFYYEFNSDLKSNQLISSINQNPYPYYNNDIIQSRGLSCVYMKNNYYNCTIYYGSNQYSCNHYCNTTWGMNFFPENLVCFYLIILENKPTLISSFYTLNPNLIVKDEKYILEGLAIFNDTNLQDVTFIKSSTDKDKLNSLICFYDLQKDTTYCSRFSVGFQHGHFDGSFNITTPCRNKIYAMDVRFFSQTQDIIFSCIGYNGIIQTTIYDSELNFTQSTIMNVYPCENISGFSLIYNNEGSYNIISDINCNGTEYPSVPLGKNLTLSDEINEEKDITNDYEHLIEDSIQIEFEKKNEEKCETYNEESLSKNLCLKCNTSGGYYPLNNEIFSIQKNMYISNDTYVDCANEETKPSNYYFNTELNKYSPCFETCATCDYGGNEFEHNCTSCDVDLIKRPEFNYTKNCVVKCSYYYYYTLYGQYKCSNSSLCPKHQRLLIRDIGKCTNNCKNENLYKYQYNGECLKKCPNYTKEDENFICKDNVNKCYLSKYDIYLNHYSIDNEIETIVENYAIEFDYTENHVSIYNDNLNEIVVYKNDECLHELNLQISEINFGLCYSKIQVKYKRSKKLIIVVVIKKVKDQNIKTTKFYIYDPETGEKIPYEKICENYTAIVHEYILPKINLTSININSMLFLTKQNIDIFNLSSPFYSDICYSFETYNKKDISLRDRISIIFPNITLCENGCQIKSINLTALKTNCDCKINKFLCNDIFEGNALYENYLNEIDNLIRQTNINIIKCYKYALFYIYFIRNIGGYIIGFLILLQIIFTIIYYKRSLYLTKKYIFTLIEKYLKYLNNLIQKNNISNENNSFYLCEVDSYNKNNNINIINKNGPPIRKKKYLKRNFLRLALSDKNINNNVTSNIAKEINNNDYNDINNNNKITGNINNEINNINNDINHNNKDGINNGLNCNVFKRKKKRGRTSKVYYKRSSKKRVSMPINFRKCNNLNEIDINNNYLKENRDIHNYDNISNVDNLIANSGNRLINLNYSNLKRTPLKDSSGGGTKLLFVEENSNMSKDVLLKNKAFAESYKDLKEEDLNIKNDIEEYMKTDFDDMDYDDALKKDKREFSTYLYDKLKSSQIILNTFYHHEPLRPKPIKILLFILDIDLYFLVNGLFFNEEYISEVYHLEEEETFFSFIPRAWNRFLYTTLVGVVVNYVIDCFFIEEKKIKGIFKREKDNSLFLKYETINIIKELNKRYNYFIILSFIVTIFTWYYVSCFNYVYKYSRIEWIKSTILIIIIMQLISVLTCLLESIIRFLGFKLKSEKIYKISLLL